jgi:uncharacterized protein YdgA (DUF945 family)
MNRWLVVLLVLLAVVILVSPGIIGRLAEQNMEEGIEWAESESPGVAITTEAFDRGWFTSEGQHRVVLEGGQFQDATESYAAATGNPELPSLIIDTRIDHGLLPLSSLTRDSGSLVPGLASTISTFQLDPGNGEPVELPGTLVSAVSLSGASDSRFTMESGRYEYEDLLVNWQGADLSIYSDRSSGEMAVHGSIEPFGLTGDDGEVRVGSIQIDADQARSEYGFYVGSTQVSMGEMTVNDNGQQIAFGGMDIAMDSSIEDGRFGGGGTATIGNIGIPGFGDVSMSMDVSMSGVQAEPFGIIISEIRDAQAAPDPDLAMQLLLPTIEDELQAMMTAGMEFRFDQLDITLPQGTVQTSIVLDVAETDASGDFSWPAVLLATTANIDLRVPAELFDLATMMNPQAGSLIAMGILQQEGEDYVMKAEYAQGLVSVNGAPIPIPIPGLTP